MTSCALQGHATDVWETIVHQILPLFLVITSSITLLLRVLWQKHRVHQVIQWRRHRKLTIQLLSVSLLNLLFFFPNILIIIVYLAGLWKEKSHEIKKYTEFLSYFVTLLFSFVALASLPELRRKIQRMAS